TFFVVPTRVHERYLFPLVALGAILATFSWRWRIAYFASALATFANMYFVLTTLYPNNPSIRDWLGTGKALGSWQAVAIAAIVQAGVLVFAFLQLRAGQAKRLASELDASGAGDRFDEDERWQDIDEPIAAEEELPEDGSGSPRPVATVRSTAVGASMAGDWAPSDDPAPYPAWDERPSSGEIGLFGWLRHRLNERPVRRDRSRELHGESGGRVDRLDVWMMAVLAMTLLTVRVWRLGEPYQMHFDEVYHPRTAVEFLQDWRYGISHDIYEWTHPHLAKYAMAGGIVAWGNDRTTATSELGGPVSMAVVEPRWDERTTATQRAGDRVWLISGGAIRAYDLATRALITEVAVPGAQTLAIDRVAHRVLIGTESGEIRAIDTTFLDFARQTGANPDPGSIESTLLATLDGPVDYLIVTPDGGTIVAVTPAAPGTGDGSIAIVLDASTGAETGRASTGKVLAIDEAGSGSVALAVPSGVAFLDVTSATVPTTIQLIGAPTGMAFTTNLDKDRLYVSYVADDGPHVATVNAPGTGGTPSLDTIFTLPGSSAGWVAYDRATQMVHVLGTRPGTGEPTVYVVEPHSRAVYADAALPFSPSALVLDANQRYPASDREQLLAFSATGSIASVDVGHHAYAWRLPGVLAGIAMAVLLYLLARILFRRREVAVILGFLIAVDGMLFAQSRIGMNDAYVGLGIVAAYVLFAAIWRSGASRGRWLAFWLAMPAIGVALGFALAAKWVAVYAIGALGVLVLARSALGRLLLVAGLVLATTVLGYLGLSVPVGQSGGNYLFISLMIALTLVASTAIVLHPIAWSDEEERLLVWGPATVGILVLGGAIAVGRAGHEYVLGPVKVTPTEAGFALVGLSAVIVTVVALIGRWGFGPRAAPPAAHDPARHLAAAEPAPEGWLRPGAMLGLPMAWVVFCLVAIPLGLYVVSYLPWAYVEGHRILDNWPVGHEGQTLWDLTQAMYRYHNTLSSPHAASSPWWAWAFDFKPVWFYQQSFAGGTAAAIYDAGNLVAWWIAIPGMAFVAWQAFARRSPALALIAIGFAWQWLGWSRIDRAAFQYHYYTSLPFLFLALAYFLAEVWHGASRRTWLLIRLAGAAAVLAPSVLWLLHRPLCAFVRVDTVNPDSRACPTLIP
ncbi:MAG: phospholipid carrier-dependent glycosyltransferase, partial [Chloroflexota bacterium]